MISQQIANHVLQRALQTGADFAEIFIEDRDSLSLSMLDGRVENIVAAREYGVGIRLLCGDQSIYVYANDTSDDALMLLAQEAAAALNQSNQSMLKDIVFASKIHKPLSPIVHYPSDVAHQKKIAYLSQGHQVAKEYSSEISQVSASYADLDQRIWLFNSEGLETQDRRVRTRVAIQSVASSGTEFQTGYEAPGSSMGIEMLHAAVDMAEIAQIASKQAVTMLHAKECPASVVPVVIDGGFGGVIFHEACGHALEATSVAKGDSVFSNRLGEMIASPCVSAVDDGTLPNEWGTLTIDDEGHPTQHNSLIENGVLKGYLIDRLGARRMNMPQTGSGRRQNHCYAPTSRMNNTFICPGNDDEEKMLHEVETGLFAKSMGGGSVNPLTGEFNFAVREGYWIQNGDLIPVRGATLIGKGAEVLQKIDRVGPKMWMGAGMCGSISGSVPTNVGQPRIRVSSLTVGGKGGAI